MFTNFNFDDESFININIRYKVNKENTSLNRKQLSTYKSSKETRNYQNLNQNTNISFISQDQNTQQSFQIIQQLLPSPTQYENYNQVMDRQYQNKSLNNKRKLQDLPYKLPEPTLLKKKQHLQDKQIDLDLQDFKDSYKEKFQITTKNLIKGLMVKFSQDGWAQLIKLDNQIQNNQQITPYLNHEYKDFIKNYVKTIKTRQQIMGIFRSFSLFETKDIQSLLSPSKKQQKNKLQLQENDPQFFQICEIIGGFQQNKKFILDPSYFLEDELELQQFNQQISNINTYNLVNRLLMQRFLTFIATNNIFSNKKVKDNRSYNNYALQLILRKIRHPSELQYVKII